MSGVDAPSGLSQPLPSPPAVVADVVVPAIAAIVASEAVVESGML